MILCALVAFEAYLQGLSFIYNILIMQYLMPGFASGSISCFIYLKFSGLNEIFTPETGFVAVMSGTVTVYDDYSLSASPPRFLPDTKKPLPCQERPWRRYGGCCRQPHI